MREPKFQVGDEVIVLPNDYRVCPVKMIVLQRWKIQSICREEQDYGDKKKSRIIYRLETRDEMREKYGIDIERNWFGKAKPQMIIEDVSEHFVYTPEEAKKKFNEWLEGKNEN